MQHVLHPRSDLLLGHIGLLKLTGLLDEMTSSNAATADSGSSTTTVDSGTWSETSSAASRNKDYSDESGKVSYIDFLAAVQCHCVSPTQ